MISFLRFSFFVGCWSLLFVVAGCVSDNQQDSVNESSTPVLVEPDDVVLESDIVQWELVDGSGITTGSLVKLVSEIDDALRIDVAQAFSVTQPTVTELRSDDTVLSIDFSEGYVNDSLVIRSSTEKKQYPFPYNTANNERLQSDECFNESDYNSILCYMPRVNGLYGLFDNVFTSNHAIVYSVSSYESANNHYILDIDELLLVPHEGQLLYFTDDYSRVFSTTYGVDSVYQWLTVFLSGDKKELIWWGLDGFFFDWSYVYAYSVDQISDEATLSLIDSTTLELTTIWPIDMGQVAFFMQQNGKLYIRYAKILYAQERQEEYVLQYDLDRWVIDRRVRIEDSTS